MLHMLHLLAVLSASDMPLSGLRAFPSAGATVAAHAAAARALDRVCYPKDGMWSAAQFEEEIRSPRTAALGAWTVGDSGDEALVGMCFTSTVLDEASLTSLAVHPRLRRRGIGEALVCESMARAQAAGAARFLLEVRLGNEAALRLYGRCGLTVAGRRPRYYRDGEDALLLSASLPAGGGGASPMCRAGGRLSDDARGVERALSNK